jgi:sugar phosphate isomerase/epimerase
MKTMHGPAIFLAQFARDEVPYNTLEGLCAWAEGHGYRGIQIPAWDARIIDIEKAAESESYCDELIGIAASHGLQITELASHLQGQLVAVHPAYDTLFDNFAPAALHGKPGERTEWAIRQLKLCAKASRHLGLEQHVTFSGALLWPFVYPWPQRPQGLVEEGFRELAKRWMPIFNEFDALGINVCFELHPNEDLHDGITFERFLDATNHHPRIAINYDPSHFILQHLDYLQFIDFYHERIKAFHVKDAELNPTGKCGVYGGYADWIGRAGRFRSPGDGQVDFGSIFSKLAQYDYEGWAVVEWECCIKDGEQGAAESAMFVASHMIRVTERAFDDFAGGDVNRAAIRNLLGIK